MGGGAEIKIQTLNLKNIQKLHKIRVKNQYLQLDLTIIILRTKCTWLWGHIYTYLMPPSLYTWQFNHTEENEGFRGRRDGKDHDAGCCLVLFWWVLVLDDDLRGKKKRVSLFGKVKKKKSTELMLSWYEDIDRVWWLKPFFPSLQIFKALWLK